MRLTRVMLAVFISLSAAMPAWAVMKEPVNESLKALFIEMRTHADAEKKYREQKKAEIVALETQIDQIRADGKAKGEKVDREAIKPLQLKRLALLEEVARRDVASSQEGMQFAQRKLDISKDNLKMFEQKMAEARKKLGT